MRLNAQGSEITPVTIPLAQKTLDVCYDITGMILFDFFKPNPGR